MSGAMAGIHCASTSHFCGGPQAVTTTRPPGTTNTLLTAATASKLASVNGSAFSSPSRTSADGMRSRTMASTAADASSAVTERLEGSRAPRAGLHLTPHPGAECRVPHAPH